jgi:dihydropyrimidinase
MAQYDLVIRGGTVVNANGCGSADIGIRGERIVALGEGLDAGAREIDATGRLVMPGGVDSHAHIEQMTAAGIRNADTFETATRAAAFGGTTTVIPFAAQHVGLDLREVVRDYLALACAGSVIDYTFHLIVADPTQKTIEEDIPALVREGHGSIKLFMTYDRLRVEDEKLLDVLMAARKAGAMICVHAENHGMLAWMGKRLVDRGYVAPRYHAVSHPRLAEVEAFHRIVAFSEFIDQPVMIFHVSTAEGIAVIRDARGRGLKIFAETCPQYLFMTADVLDLPGIEGAKFLCSPPTRTTADQEALWRAIELGDIQTVSSDHAPFRMDETGKLRAGPDATFKQMGNGMPGLETRLPVLFDEMVSKGRLGPEKFVEIAATAPARLYNLAPRKGALAVGADADIAIWDPQREVVLDDSTVQDASGYTPFPGRRLRGWPETVLVRGRVVIADGALQVRPGHGCFLPRQGGDAARPTGRLVPEFAPQTNFGADLT